MINSLSSAAGAWPQTDNGERTGFSGLAEDHADSVFGNPIADVAAKVAAQVAAEATAQPLSKTLLDVMKHLPPEKPLGAVAKEALKERLPEDERLAYELGGEKGLKEYQAMKPLLPEWARNPAVIQELTKRLEHLQK